MTPSRYIRRSSVYGALFRAIGMVLSFLIGVFLARDLGPVQYGFYGLAVASSAIVAAVISAGLPGLVGRESSTASAKGDSEKLMRLLAWTWVLFARVFACFLLIIVLSQSTMSSTKYGVLFVLTFGLGATLSCTAIFASFLRGIGEFLSSQALENSVRPAVSLFAFGTLLLVGIELNAERAVAVQLFASALVAILGAFLFFSKAPHFRYLRATRAQARRWFRSAIPIGAVEFVRMIDGHYPVLTIPAVAEIDVAGQYKVAAAVVVVVMIPYAVFNTIAVPFISRQRALEDTAAIGRFARFASAISASSAALATVGFYFLGDTAIRFIFGEEYAGVSNIVIVLCLAHTITALFGINPALLVAEGHEKPLLFVLAITTALGVLLSFLFAERLNGVGVAWAVAVVATVRSVWLYLYTHKKIGVDCSPLPYVKDIRDLWR